MKRSKHLLLAPLVLLSASAAIPAEKVELVPVVSREFTQTIELPGEFLPFQQVELHAKVRGYVSEMLVDRGSVVKKGQVLAVITAPEMKAQIGEAESKVQAAESERLQARAQLTAAQSTYERLQKAAQTPGAIAGNELIQAQEQVRAADAMLQSKLQARAAAQQTLKAQEDLASYLRITAPFAGVITERLVHPGALVGPGSDPVMLTLAEITRLRLVVAVPEQNVGEIKKGAHVALRVPAFPTRTYTGTVARNAHALDEKTRTMAVELDVTNRDRSLSPGMYPSVRWPVQRSKPSLLVPKTSVVTTTERTFVIRAQQGRAEWVDVSKGMADGDLIEVFGNLHPGDNVVRRANDEIRAGTPIDGQTGRVQTSKLRFGPG